MRICRRCLLSSISLVVSWRSRHLRHGKVDMCCFLAIATRDARKLRWAYDPVRFFCAVHSDHGWHSAVLWNSILNSCSSVLRERQQLTVSDTNHVCVCGKAFPWERPKLFHADIAGKVVTVIPSGKCQYHPLMHSTEFADLIALDQASWPRCFLWH